jgi:NitT/TauT family transport system substrate-binding protein
VADGKIPALCNLRVHLWKDLDSLRAVLLAGKGDLWLGHCEGFAQAALQGAPVSVLVVSGWRKFFFLSRNADDRDIASLTGKVIPFTPVASPAVPVMRSLAQRGGPSMEFQPFEPKRLALALSAGTEQRALAPEPLVTTLLTKVPDLRIVGSLEDLYGRITGGPARMPIAGLAVNLNTVRAHPRLIAKLVEVIRKQALVVEKLEDKGARFLPAEFQGHVSPEMVISSLQRDLVLVRTGQQAAPELKAYLSMLLPGGEQDLAALPRGFLWK